MEAKVKHLVSLAIKKMKSVGAIGKKKRKRRNLLRTSPSRSYAITTGQKARPSTSA